jgi:hypothetical protein
MAASQTREFVIPNDPAELWDAGSTKLTLVVSEDFSSEWDDREHVIVQVAEGTWEELVDVSLRSAFSGGVEGGARRERRVERQRCRNERRNEGTISPVWHPVSQRWRMLCAGIIRYA